MTTSSREPSGSSVGYPRGAAAEAHRTRLLRDGQLEIVGQLVDASNATLYCTASLDGEQAECVYKPTAGERPLWDFPTGTLAQREYATYLVSQTMGDSLVPTTVLRDGPFGGGMVQWWVEVDETVDLVALVRSQHRDLQQLALLDAIVNNADRKGGHLLPLPDGHVMGIDHGVTFAEEYKLRTLLWQWEGQRLPEDLMEVVERVDIAVAHDNVGVELRTLMNPQEYRALRRRVRTLLTSRTFPSPSPDWPAVPWPPF